MANASPLPLAETDVAWPRTAAVTGAGRGLGFERVCRMLAAGLLTAAIVGCGGAGETPPAPGPIGGEEGHAADIADGEPETVYEDALPDAPEDIDPDTAAAVAEDASEDVGPDVPPPALPAACPETLELLPAWADVLADGTLVVTGCDAGAVPWSVAVHARTAGALRVRRGPDAGTAARSFAVVPTDEPPPVTRVGATEAGDVVFCTDGLRVLLTPPTSAGPRGPCAVTVRDAAERLLERDVPQADAGAAYVGTPMGPVGDVPGDPDGPPGARLRTAASPGAVFLGWGERNGPQDRRGRQMTFWNTDAYDSAVGGYAPDQDPLYLGVPFGLTLAADGHTHGVVVDVPWKLTLDIASADPDAVVLDSWDPTTHVERWILAGPTPADVMARYAELTGHPPLPPAWALGYHQCRWGYSPDTAVTAVAETFRELAMPADTLWLDIQHLDGFRTFTFDPVTFPDPPALEASLDALGFQLVVIVDPGLKADPGWDVYEATLAGDHALRWPDELPAGLDPALAGAPFVGTVWPGPSVFPDFTRPETRAWWAGEVAALAALGVDGIWLDVNEPTVFPESGDGATVHPAVAAAGDGVPTNMAEGHNVYALREAEATRAGLAADNPDDRPFVLSRAGYLGIQRAAAVWTGDVPSTWEGLQSQLPMLLGLSMSGVPFIGSDVGGYSGGPSPELFARWMALGSVSPFFRGHVTNGAPDQEPWAFGQEVQDLSRAFLEERMRLLPYLQTLMAEAHVDGAPPLRPMAWEFPADPALRVLDDQAMLGPWLMVAPVLEPEATTRTVQVPPGRWFERHSGAFFDGPTTVTVRAPLAARPTYVREGAILPTGPVAANTRELAPDRPLTLEAWPGAWTSVWPFFEDPGQGAPEATTGASGAVRILATGHDGERAWLSVGAASGAVLPPARRVVTVLHRVDAEPSTVLVGASADAPDLSSASMLDATQLAALRAGEAVGWAWDPADLSVVVAVDQPAGGPPLHVEARFPEGYDVSLRVPAPLVAVAMTVTVPASTPADSLVHVASDANGWEHQPFEWLTPPDAATGQPGVAAGTLSVPRGDWYDFKFTRGDWCTVEKWPACEEASNRYAFGAAWPPRAETVWEWRDACEPCR